MAQENGRLRELVQRGEVERHRRVARKARAGKRFRTFKLKPGVRIERAAKALH